MEGEYLLGEKVAECFKHRSNIVSPNKFSINAYLLVACIRFVCPCDILLFALNSCFKVKTLPFIIIEQMMKSLLAFRIAISAKIQLETNTSP